MRGLSAVQDADDVCLAPLDGPLREAPAEGRFKCPWRLSAGVGCWTGMPRRGITLPSSSPARPASPPSDVRALARLPNEGDTCRSTLLHVGVQGHHGLVRVPQPLCQVRAETIHKDKQRLFEDRPQGQFAGLIHVQLGRLTRD